jgi:hypothetical protein
MKKGGLHTMSNPAQEIGLRVIRDGIKDLMREQGIEEVPSFEITFKNGEVTTILSDNHPALDREMSDVTSIKPKSGAEAGHVN